MNKHVGLYIHWPFCDTKCPYCAFNSYAIIYSPLLIQQYVQAVENQLKVLKKRTPYITLGSIYIGGGTPNLMPTEALNHMMQTIVKIFDVPKHCESTIEINPTHITKNQFLAWKKMGINRMSIGVQSMTNSTLQHLGRRHTIQQALSIYQQATSVFDRVSIDLIYGHPWHSLQEWKNELHQAFELFQATHMSIYELTIEPHTPFSYAVKKQDMTMPDDHKAGIFFLKTRQWMCKAGYDPYEISNYAKSKKYYGQHNLNYWAYKPFYGIGPGAHGRYYDRTNNAYMESYATPNPNTWVKQTLQNPILSLHSQSLTVKQQWEEMVLVGLRTSYGLLQSHCIQTIGMDFSNFNQEILFDMQNRGYLKLVNDFSSHCNAHSSGNLALPNADSRLLSEDSFLSSSNLRLYLTSKGFLRFNAVISALL